MFPAFFITSATWQAQKHLSKAGTKLHHTCLPLSLHLLLREGYQVLHTARGHTFKDIKKEKMHVLLVMSLVTTHTILKQAIFWHAALVEPLRAAGILPRVVQT